MSRLFPAQVQAGDIFGHRFPTSSDPSQAHPGLVLKVFDGAHRQKMLEMHRKPDVPGAALCLVLMISHSFPKAGQFGELIALHYRDGSRLDGIRDIYACYKHYDIAYLPGQAVKIMSVNGEYLGRMPAEGVKHFLTQLVAVQDFQKGRSFKRPDGVFVA